MNQNERDELVRLVREETARIFETKLNDFLEKAAWKQIEFLEQAEEKCSFATYDLRSLAGDVKGIRELQRADLTQSFENSLGVPAMLALKHLRANKIEEAIRELDGLRMKLINRTIADISKGR